jgi:hypothetical protein
LCKRIVDDRVLRRVAIAVTGLALTANGPIVVGGMGLWTDDNPWQKSKRDGFLLQFNAEGETLWRRTFGGDGLQDPRAIAVLADGTIVAAGRASHPGRLYGYPHAWGFSAGGELRWRRHLVQRRFILGSGESIVVDGDRLLIAGSIKRAGGRWGTDVALMTFRTSASSTE